MIQNPGEVTSLSSDTNRRNISLVVDVKTMGSVPPTPAIRPDKPEPVPDRDGELAFGPSYIYKIS